MIDWLIVVFQAISWKGGCNKKTDLSNLFEIFLNKLIRSNSFSCIYIYLKLFYFVLFYCILFYFSASASYGEKAVFILCWAERGRRCAALLPRRRLKTIGAVHPQQWLQLNPDQTLSCRGAESSKDRRIRGACSSVSERRDFWTSKVKIVS